MREITWREQENIEGKAFAEKIEAIYEKFEAAKERINATTFNFLRKQSLEEVVKPEINFQNTHFKFNGTFPGNSRKDRGLPTAFYLTKKEGEYHVYWRQEKANLAEKNLVEVSAFLKFYLTFCAMLQIAAKEFFSEMLPENI